MLISNLKLSLTVNGHLHEVEVPARRLLSDFLRDDLNLTGTKRGCEAAICGACSVLVDGEVMKSCLLLAAQMHRREVTTVEGLVVGDVLHPLQEAFMEKGGFQCGYCTPGMLIAACALLNENPNPTRAEVRAGLRGNLCRCTGYTAIVDSVLAAADKLRGT